MLLQLTAQWTFRGKTRADMEKNVNELLLKEDLSARELVRNLEDGKETLGLETSFLYFNFPLYKDEEEHSSKANVLLVSIKHGIIIFECSDISHRVSQANRLLSETSTKLEQTYTQIFSRLIRSPLLRKKPNEIKFPFEQLIYIPNYGTSQLPLIEQYEYIKVCNSFNQVAEHLNEIKLPQQIDDFTFKEILAVLEGSKGIIKPKERPLSKRLDTKGRILQEIEMEIANFDRDQKRAALNIIDGPQRIRGLAGSGKTIVLTWKAALIHLQHPDATVVYTFYTKSLYEFIQRLITRFYRQYSDKDPDWNKIHIRHAWGGRNVAGVYSDICHTHNIPTTTFSEAKNLGGDRPFDEVCKKLLSNRLNKLYDYTIIDEAQDFPPSFYQLCLSVTENKRIIWGYDECQNILNIDIQDTKKTFGKDKNGQYSVDLSKSPDGVNNDVVLHICYRNPREILIYAFALGLGLYNNRILQMPENNDHWEDLGFKVLQGTSKTRDGMKIERPIENSPLAKNKLLKSDEVFTLQTFSSVEEECDYVAQEIVDDIKSELLPEDILVISLDDRFARKYFDRLSVLLSKRKIHTYDLMSAPSISTTFSLKNHITLSTVYRAKGNEAGRVYVVGVDSAFITKDSISSRNKIFTALTRAKGWLTVTGVGQYAKAFEKEYKKAKETYPYFIFTMPDRASLKTFQRDLNESQAEINTIQRKIMELADKTGKSPEEIMEQITKTSKRKK
jgi:superfamily I DNA and RNA helicase